MDHPADSLPCPGTYSRLLLQRWPTAAARLLAGTGDEPYVYFANSYYVPEEVAGERAAALSDYGIRYTAAIESGNVFGVQFHPEKSASVGQQIVRNFLAC